jgi:cytochrome oxidase Cu insertion factor (SCO1/SenC/PrrC family)
MRMKIFAALAATAALTVSALAMGPVPRPAPNLDFVDANGKHIMLSSYRGKVVVIQFLLTTCPHCQAMSSMVLTKMQAELGPRGFQALGVAYNATEDPRVPAAQAVRDYASKYATDFPVGYDAHEPILAFLGDSVMDRLGFPQVVVVDKKGIIRAQSEPSGTAALQDEHSLTTLVDGLLKEGAISKK